MDPDALKPSFDELVTIGSEWWYFANLTYDKDTHVYPVVKIDSHKVYVATDKKGSLHSEYKERFLDKFVKARTIFPKPVFSIQAIMGQALQFGMSEEFHELLVETDI